MNEQQLYDNLCTLISDRDKIHHLGHTTDYLDKLINFLKIELDIDEVDCIIRM